MEVVAAVVLPIIAALLIVGIVSVVTANARRLPPARTEPDPPAAELRARAAEPGATVASGDAPRSAASDGNSTAERR